MKKTLLILIIISPLFCFAQKTDSVIFRKAAKILINNVLPASDNFTKAGQGLIQAGFMIGSKDKDFNQIISEPISLSFGHQKIYIIYTDNKVILTCKYRPNTTLQIISSGSTDSDYDPVIYHKQSNTDSDCFDNMMKVAKMISGKIIYSE